MHILCNSANFSKCLAQFHALWADRKRHGVWFFSACLRDHFNPADIKRERKIRGVLHGYSSGSFPFARLIRRASLFLFNVEHLICIVDVIRKLLHGQFSVYFPYGALLSRSGHGKEVLVRSKCNARKRHTRSLGNETAAVLLSIVLRFELLLTVACMTS